MEKKKKFPFKKEFPRKDEYNEKSFLDLRKMETLDYRRLSKKLGIKVATQKDLIKKNLGFNFVKQYGKVGFMKLREDGSTQYVVTDGNYLFDRGYRNAVNSTGYRPVFWRQLLLAKKKGKVVSLDNEIKKVTKDVPIWKFSKNEKDAYLKSLVLVKKKVPLDYVRVKKSINRLTKEDFSNRSIKKSIREGVRQAVLDQKASDLKGKLCRMTATKAENPDLEHALLEWKVMPCDEVLKHLSRFGCRHDFEVVS